jgi:hypothetical protein
MSPRKTLCPGVRNWNIHLITYYCHLLYLTKTITSNIEKILMLMDRGGCGERLQEGEYGTDFVNTHM